MKAGQKSFSFPLLEALNKREQVGRKLTKEEKKKGKVNFQSFLAKALFNLLQGQAPSHSFCILTESTGLQAKKSIQQFITDKMRLTNEGKSRTNFKMKGSNKRFPETSFSGTTEKSPKLFPKTAKEQHLVKLDYIEEVRGNASPLKYRSFDLPFEQLRLSSLYKAKEKIGSEKIKSPLARQGKSSPEGPESIPLATAQKPTLNKNRMNIWVFSEQDKKLMMKQALNKVNLSEKEEGSISPYTQKVRSQLKKSPLAGKRVGKEEMVLLQPFQERKNRVNNKVKEALSINEFKEKDLSESRTVQVPGSKENTMPALNKAITQIVKEGVFEEDGELANGNTDKINSSTKAKITNNFQLSTSKKKISVQPRGEKNSPKQLLANIRLSEEGTGKLNFRAESSEKHALNTSSFADIRKAKFEGKSPSPLNASLLLPYKSLRKSSQELSEIERRSHSKAEAFPKILRVSSSHEEKITQKREEKIAFGLLKQEKSSHTLKGEIDDISAQKNLDPLKHVKGEKQTLSMASIKSFQEKESRIKEAASTIGELKDRSSSELKMSQALSSGQDITSHIDHSQPFIRENTFPQLREGRELIGEIVDKIKFLTEHQERREARIVLKPEHLGTLRLHLSMQKTELTLGIQVSDPRTGELIQKNLAYLRASLEKEGLFLKDFSLSLEQNFDFDGGERERNLPFAFERKPFPAGSTFFSDEKEKEVIRLTLERHYINYRV